MLPEKHFPLQDLELERTDLYQFEGDQSKPKLLFALRGPGGMGCLLPVLEDLKSQNYSLSLLTDSAAKKILEQQKLGFNFKRLDSPLSYIANINHDVAVCEFSADAGISLPVTWNSKFNSVPTVWVEDFPGQPSLIFKNSLSINPNFICTINNFSRDIHIKLKPDMPKDRVVVTGHSGFDEYAKINGKEVRKNTREKLDVEEDEFLVVFSGQLQPDTPLILKALVDSLNCIEGKKITLLFSKHPRDITSQKEYQYILNNFRGKVVNQDDISSDDIGFAADLLATRNSTEGIKSAYRRVPVIHLIPQEIVAPLAEDLTPLPVRFGVSPMVSSLEEINEKLKKIILDENYQKALIKGMEEVFISDGKATQRVIDVILKAASL